VIRGATRYRLLETVRHYAAERLTLRAGSDASGVRAAHRDHYDLVRDSRIPGVTR